MSTIQQPVEVDGDKLHQFVFQAVEEVGATLNTALVVMGDRLGLYRAMADGGPVFVDPRVPLARALFQLGRVAEAQAIISKLKTDGPADPRICDMIAELLVERGDLEAALEWATTGVQLCLGQPTAPTAATGPRQPGNASELPLLLSLRYRIRNDLGLREDEYDQLLDEA